MLICAEAEAAMIAKTADRKNLFIFNGTYAKLVDCKYPYNIASFLCSKINSIFPISNSSNIEQKEFSQIPSNIENSEENNDVNNPAKILSSEEINEMIKDQIKYSKEQTNSNGYKIIKQKNPYDSVKSGELMNMEEIKKEINQIEFEQEEQKQNDENKNP